MSHEQRSPLNQCQGEQLVVKCKSDLPVKGGSFAARRCSRVRTTPQHPVLGLHSFSVSVHWRPVCFYSMTSFALLLFDFSPCAFSPKVWIKAEFLSWRDGERCIVQKDRLLKSHKQSGDLSMVHYLPIVITALHQCIPVESDCSQSRNALVSRDSRAQHLREALRFPCVLVCAGVATRPLFDARVHSLLVLLHVRRPKSLRTELFLIPSADCLNPTRPHHKPSSLPVVSLSSSYFHSGRFISEMWLKPVIFFALCLLFETTSALPSTDLAFRSYRVGLSTNAETAATSLSTDDYGNTYIVGNTYGSFGKPDMNHLSDMSIFIAKFSRSGILVWLRRTGSSFPDQALGAFYFGAMLYVTGSTKGDVSMTASSADTSTGIQDGFVLAYDSFTGKRKWSRQIGGARAFTEVNVVSVSALAGVVISGHSNSSLFGSLTREVAGDELFVARLNHASGVVEQKAQYQINSTPMNLIPRQIVTTKDNRFIHVIVEVDNRSFRKESIFVSLLEGSYKISRKHSMASIGMNKVSQGLVEDVETGKIVISYSVANDGPESSRDFGLQTVATSTPNNFTGPMAVADLDSNSDDVCKGIVINKASYALMLGTISKRGGEDSKTLGVWIYDLRNSRTVGLYEANKAMLGSSMKIAGFTTDDTGNIVFAGVRIPEGGTQREILLGTFGIPGLLQERSEDSATPLSLDSDSNTASNAVSDVNQAAVEFTASQSGLFSRGPDGKLGTGAILVICLCVVVFILVLATGFACFVRRRRARVEQK